MFKPKFIYIDLFNFFEDLSFYFFGFQNFLYTNKSIKVVFLKNITWLNDFRKYIFKKYIYTINHKRIAINYFFFSMWTGLSGAALATMIRLELSTPAVLFLKETL